MVSSRASLTQAQARRVALAAQGFGRAQPAQVTASTLRNTVRRLGLVQIDSVNVLVRSHYLPLFARVGHYTHEALDALVYGRGRSLFEYWGHEASLLPVSCQPLLRWRMDDARAGQGLYRSIVRFGQERADYIAAALDELRTRGPLSASELSQAGASRGAWWGWSDGKIALEWLFWTGAITTAYRRGFERVYDLTERVLPAAIVQAPTPSREDAQRALLAQAAQAMGVATEADLRDYFRLAGQPVRARLEELVEAGTLIPVQVQGWRQPAWMDATARVPRAVQAAALLSPFDSLVWNRDRTERLFDLRYRLEIYTPVEKRQFGYYVLPFLLGDALVGRVDLKADRAAGCLQVLAAHREAHAVPDVVAPPLMQALRRMATWLGLGAVRIHPRGDLAPALMAAASST